MRLLDRLRKDLAGLVHREAEILAVAVDALLVEAVEDQRDRFGLDVAPFLVADAEPLEFVGTVAGAHAELKASVAQDIDEGRILDDPHRMVQRHDHDRRAEPDSGRLRCQIRQKAERVRQDAVFVGKMVLGDPYGIETQLFRFEDLAGDTLVNAPVRIGFGPVVRVRGEEDADLHGRRAFGSSTGFAAASLAGCGCGCTVLFGAGLRPFGMGPARTGCNGAARRLCRQIMPAPGPGRPPSG